MSHLVTIWRAAQLVGVSRGVLQQHIRDGRLRPTDGLLSTDELLVLYPQVRLEETGLLERVGRIKDEAFARRVRERLLPSQDVLAQRLFAQSQELADVRRHLQRYHALVVALQRNARSRAAASGEAAWAEFSREIDAGLAAALATESVDDLQVMDDMLKVMSAQVSLRPSGHAFLVEGHDTLLQAGLRAGLKLNYGCGNGSCGMCKVRVISGEVARTGACDYPMSAGERQQGYVLMCAHTAASSEVVLETLEAGGPQDIPLQQVVAQVRAISPLGNDTTLVHLQTPRSARLRFLAGQSMRLGIQRGGQDYQGVHPVASCPCDDRNLHFYIPREADDDFSRQVLAGGLERAEPVTVWGPFGDFVLGESTRPLVFAACDVGFAPVKSLIEHAMALDAAPAMTLYWLATRPDGHFMNNLCRAWSAALDPFEYNPVAHADPAEGALQMAAAIRADLFDIDCDFYLAGPQAFVDVLGTQLRAAGVPAAQCLAQVV
jgi:CDP-4-dehydro-6-deoxyglucose reductase